MWIAQLFPFERPRSLLTSGGLGTMGYGLPAGIGAKFAAPDRDVVVVSGDGSIQMNIQELGTAVQYNVDIKVVILNNYLPRDGAAMAGALLPGALSPTPRCPCRISSSSPTLTAPRASASRSRAISSPSMKEAFATPGPVLIDVVIPKEEAVMPMIPPGGSMSEMLFA